MEQLVSALTELVRRPIGPPTVPETIVVQGRGMERWLSMELARRLGVWAHPSFPFPRTLIEDAMGRVLGDEEALETHRWEPEVVAWAVAAILPELVERPAFAPIRTYLAHDGSSGRRLQLADRIARVFDQYVVYRPRMITRWERGHGDDWQAELWRALIERHHFLHVAHRAEAFLHRMASGDGDLSGLPPRVSLFGISALPPLYLQLLSALSLRLEVHLFMLSPSQEYWADIQSKRQQLRTMREAQGISELTEADLHLGEGHPLLASLGKLGRHFQETIESLGDYHESDEDRYVDPGTDTLLHTIQSDILHLKRRAPEERVSLGDDDSIRIHACHGRMREVEVLHDQILALLDADPSLTPRDFVVMAPDVEAYAPVIEAVFTKPTNDPHRIPHRIADRGVRSTHEVVDAFAQLLDVLEGRFGASEVLDLLSARPVRERFGVGEEDLETIRGWVVEAGIRWGVDAAHRAEVDQPALGQNTWRFGLDRLLLGYAMEGEGERLFEGVLPYDEVEGSDAGLLGKLVHFAETLFEQRHGVAGERTPAGWRDALSGLLEATLHARPEDAHEHQLLRSALASLAERAERVGFEESIPLEVLRERLDAELGRELTSHAFLSGGVTFCQLVPMRSIPFRVVCLIGMDDDAFPRSQRPLGFDFVAKEPKVGDRNPRDDDRHLFLEALLSARDRLLVTYVGQSVQDNADRPPSVLVSELLDALEETCEDEDLRARLVVRHPLQPFSPRYFGADDDARLFSYADLYAEGARTLVEEREDPAAFLTQPLSPPEHSPLEASVTELERFLKHPAETFLRRRLGLSLRDDHETVEDREPIALDALGSWKLGHDLLQRALEGASLERAFTAVRAGGTLPPGTPGEVVYEDARPVAERIAEAAGGVFARSRELPPLPVELTLGGVRVTGFLRNVWPEGQFAAQFSTVGKHHELALWLRHLLLCCVAPAGHPRTSFLVGRAPKSGTARVRFDPVAEPEAELVRILGLYRLAQQAPVPLFERASRRYAEVAKKKEADAALAAARKEFEEDLKTDEHIQLLFGHADPLDPGFDPVGGALPYPGFAEVALTVYEPLLAHRDDWEPEDGP